MSEKGLTFEFVETDDQAIEYLTRLQGRFDGFYKDRIERADRENQPEIADIFKAQLKEITDLILSMKAKIHRARAWDL